MAGIKFSDEALSAFQTAVRGKLDLVEDTIIVKMKNEMALEPAFGKFPQALQAAEKYNTAFGSVWTDIQGLKNALKAIDEACTQTLKNYGKTESDNTVK